MKRILTGAIILAACFAFNGLQAVPTKLDCKNSSTNIDIRVDVEGTTTSVAHGTTVSNINIPTLTTSIQIRPPSSITGIPIIIQKNALNIAADGKYDVNVKTTLNGISLTVIVYSLGVKIGQGQFFVGV
jgi:hypothetical protein